MLASSFKMDCLWKLGMGWPLLGIVEQDRLAAVALVAGAVLEGVYTALGRPEEPRMTRFLAEQLAKTHYFSIQQAENDLGYAPIVSTEAGLDHLVSWIQAHEKIS